MQTNKSQPLVLIVDSVHNFINKFFPWITTSLSGSRGLLGFSVPVLPHYVMNSSLPFPLYPRLSWYKENFKKRGGVCVFPKGWFI